MPRAPWHRWKLSAHRLSTILTYADVLLSSYAIPSNIRRLCREKYFAGDVQESNVWVWLHRVSEAQTAKLPLACDRLPKRGGLHA